MTETYQASAIMPALIPLAQAAESDGGIPWWIWLIVISVLLLLLLIGFARQPEPGQPLPTSEERMAELAAAVGKTGDRMAQETADPAENAKNDVLQETPADGDEVEEVSSEPNEPESAPTDDL